jgi:hypothetical protein
LLCHPEALLMPLPSTRRSSLDSFLPQFAPALDDLTQQEGIPHSDNGHVDVADHSNGNGHSANPFGHSENGFVADDSAVASQNGVGDAMFETILDPLSNHLNGSSPVFAHNGVVLEPPSVMAPSASPELIPPQDDEASLESNGEAIASIAESPAPPSASSESESQLDDALNSSRNGSSARGLELPPHPATGSLFTPYLVTEIRELRSRRGRRSWWRRMFG